MIKKYLSFRWILLGTALVAMLGLTAMNVLSLYELHETTIQSDLENRKMQVAEFANRIHWRFMREFRGLDRHDIERIEDSYYRDGRLDRRFLRLIDDVAEDPLFTGIFFDPHRSYSCHRQTELLEFDRRTEEFVPTSTYPESVCNGMGIARTRMKGGAFNNRFISNNHRYFFDMDEGTMSIALINLSEREVFGYLTLTLNKEYMAEDYLQAELHSEFGNSDSSGVAVWLRDWTRDVTVASSDPNLPFDEDLVQHRQELDDDYFENWSLNVAFTESPAIAASRASLIRNFFVLGVAVSVLGGALIFIFFTAQKERELVQRQAGFLANVTHELKTPLAVMQAAGENLADGRVYNKDRLKSYGEHIHNEALRLKRMIEKLLDVAKADAGQALIEPKPEQLDQLLHEYIERQRAFIVSKEFKLDVKIERPVPPVMIDEDSFETIVSNLVENAIKYSRDEKYLGIRLFRTDDTIRVEIADHGIGIPKKALSHIFEKFYRVEDPLTAESKGHGLGLSIVKNLVELNGGEINVESKEGDGSTFMLSFPILVDPASGVEHSQNGKSIRVTPSNQRQDSPEYVG